MLMPQVEAEGWICGIMRPWHCDRCGYESYRAKWPPPPCP
jgi:predicted Zn-ribbon and HTH transcriptional regulator